MRSISKHFVFGIHNLLSRFRIHVLPVHYYSPVVNLNELKANQSDWARKSEMPGIHWDSAEQSERMRQICLPFQKEYEKNTAFMEATEGQHGPGYGPVEAQALHGFVRSFKPKRILEVGSGVSTACMLQATSLNGQDTGTNCGITCIEPFPSPQMRKLSGEGKVRLIDSFVQRVPPGVFESLEAGDLLFIDSSHAAKTGSDVYHLYLEILPKLKSGVLIHIHDIYFPYNYSPSTLYSLWHWGETSLLRALMTNNEKMRTIFCMSLMHHEHPEDLKKVFPNYEPEEMKDGLCVSNLGPMGYCRKHFPSSIYLEIV